MGGRNQLYHGDSFRGFPWEVIKMGYVKEERPTTISVEGTWNIGSYHYKGSRLLEEYVKGLKQKKLIGSFCPGCGKVIVPPRNLC